MSLIYVYWVNWLGASRLDEAAWCYYNHAGWSKLLRTSWARQGWYSLARRASCTVKMGKSYILDVPELTIPVQRGQINCGCKTLMGEWQKGDVCHYCEIQNSRGSNLCFWSVHVCCTWHPRFQNAGCLAWNHPEGSETEDLRGWFATTNGSWIWSPMDASQLL